MVYYCMNCGKEIKKDDNFCTHCGAEIKKDNNICANCGAKIKNDYKFCINCGTRIDNTHIKQNTSSLKSLTDSVEKYKTKIEREKIIMDQKREEKKKKLKTIDEIFESEEIKSEIRKNNIDNIDVLLIKDSLKNKIINKQENMTNEEIKNFIKTEFEEIRNTQETPVSSKKVKENKPTSGGYCSFGCQHCYEEFFDSGGGIVGDFDSEGYYEYYCQLGHEISFGRYCKDFK